MRITCAILLPVFVLISAVTAISAPAPKPSQKPWTDGWHAFVHEKECKLIRQESMLTFDLQDNPDKKRKRFRWNAPRIIRNVKGDFSAQVRVMGEILYPRDLDGCELSSGMIVLVGDKMCATLEVISRCGQGADELFASLAIVQRVQLSNGKVVARILGGGGRVALTGLPIHMRLIRSRNNFTAEISEDGKKWKRLHSWESPEKIPLQIDLGFFASTYSSKCRSRFDQFILTQVPSKNSTAEKNGK